MWFLIPKQLRYKAFPVSLGLVVIGNLWMWKIGLRTGAAPDGIISLQLAGNSHRAAEVLASWQGKFGSLNPAINNILVDYFLYIPAYTTALGLLCLWARDNVDRKIGESQDGFTAREGTDQRIVRAQSAHRIGTILAWGQTTAGLFDCLENAGILVMLNGHVVQPWPFFTTGAAVAKFILIITGFVYGVIGVGAWIASKLVVRSR
jgi:hypothetical protein